MQSPLRDERETLERRLEALTAENARLQAELAALPEKRRSMKPWVVAFLCLLVAPPTGCAGCYAGRDHPASKSGGCE